MVVVGRGQAVSRDSKTEQSQPTRSTTTTVTKSVPIKVGGVPPQNKLMSNGLSTGINAGKTPSTTTYAKPSEPKYFPTAAGGARGPETTPGGRGTVVLTPPGGRRVTTEKEKAYNESFYMSPQEETKKNLAESSVRLFEKLARERAAVRQEEEFKKVSGGRIEGREMDVITGGYDRNQLLRLQGGKEAVESIEGRIRPAEQAKYYSDVPVYRTGTDKYVRERAEVTQSGIQPTLAKVSKEGFVQPTQQMRNIQRNEVIDSYKVHVGRGRVGITTNAPSPITKSVLLDEIQNRPATPQVISQKSKDEKDEGFQVFSYKGSLAESYGLSRQEYDKLTWQQKLAVDKKSSFFWGTDKSRGAERQGVRSNTEDQLKIADKKKRENIGVIDETIMGVKGGESVYIEYEGKKYATVEELEGLKVTQTKQADAYLMSLTEQGLSMESRVGRGGSQFYTIKVPDMLINPVATTISSVAFMAAGGNAKQGLSNTWNVLTKKTEVPILPKNTETAEVVVGGVALVLTGGQAAMPAALTGAVGEMTISGTTAVGGGLATLWAVPNVVMPAIKEHYMTVSKYTPTPINVAIGGVKGAGKFAELIDKKAAEPLVKTGNFMEKYVEDTYSDIKGGVLFGAELAAYGVGFGLSEAGGIKAGKMIAGTASKTKILPIKATEEGIGSIINEKGLMVEESGLRRLSTVEKGRIGVKSRTDVVPWEADVKSTYKTSEINDMLKLQKGEVDVNLKRKSVFDLGNEMLGGEAIKASDTFRMTSMLESTGEKGLTKNLLVETRVQSPIGSLGSYKLGKSDIVGSYLPKNRLNAPTSKADVSVSIGSVKMPQQKISLLNEVREGSSLSVLPGKTLKGIEVETGLTHYAKPPKMSYIKELKGESTNVRSVFTSKTTGESFTTKALSENYKVADDLYDILSGGTTKEGGGGIGLRAGREFDKPKWKFLDKYGRATTREYDIPYGSRPLMESWSPMKVGVRERFSNFFKGEVKPQLFDDRYIVKIKDSGRKVKSKFKDILSGVGRQESITSGGGLQTELRSSIGGQLPSKSTTVSQMMKGSGGGKGMTADMTGGFEYGNANAYPSKSVSVNQPASGGMAESLITRQMNAIRSGGYGYGTASRLAGASKGLFNNAGFAGVESIGSGLENMRVNKSKFVPSMLSATAGVASVLKNKYNNAAGNVMANSLFTGVANKNVSRILNTNTLKNDLINRNTNILGNDYVNDNTLKNLMGNENKNKNAYKNEYKSTYGNALGNIAAVPMGLGALAATPKGLKWGGVGFPGPTEGAGSMSGFRGRKFFGRTSRKNPWGTLNLWGSKKKKKRGKRR